MTPRSSNTSWLRGCIPLPRDPANGLGSLSIKRNATLRRAKSIASVNPAAPAPAIRTSVVNCCFIRELSLRLNYMYYTHKIAQAIKCPTQRRPPPQLTSRVVCPLSQQGDLCITVLLFLRDPREALRVILESSEESRTPTH